MTYELKPIHTNQKSFYGKAIVDVVEYCGDNYHTLHSYGTAVVSVYVGPDNIAYMKRLWGGYSATTLRHVNELLMQLDFPKLSARAWRAMELGKFYTPDDVPALEKNT